MMRVKPKRFDIDWQFGEFDFCDDGEYVAWSEVEDLFRQLKDIRERLRGCDASKLDGEDGLAAATMRAADWKCQLFDHTWLAAALSSYEADEPHINDGEEEDSYYPESDPDKLAEATHLPHTCGEYQDRCDRCEAERLYHKAKWLIEKAKEQ